MNDARTVIIKCSANISQGLISELKTTLGEDVAMSYGDNTLKVQYLFPDCHFALIRSALISAGAMDGMGIIDRARYIMLAYREKNEADYLQPHSGWRHIIEAIHMAYFKPDHQTTPTAQRAHWEK